MTVASRPVGKVFWQLEAARGAAAAYIALSHIVGNQTSEPWIIRAALGFGQEVVILFFLISGFVIHWSVVHKPDMGFGAYLRARTLRIYPLFLLTLGLAAAIAHSHEPSDPRASLGTFFGNVLMLQDWGTIKPGVWVETYAGVLALWSLSYEWWFYMLYFPIAKKIPATAQAGVVAAVSVSQALLYAWYPNQASRFLIYFCIWWVGVELAKATINRMPLNLRTLRLPLGTVALVTLVLAIGAWQWPASGRLLRAGTHPILELRHFIAALGITGIALVWHRFKWAGFKKLIGPFVFVAPWSYALYVLHEPIGVHAKWFDFIPDHRLRIVLTLLLVSMSAWLAERYFQTWCRRLLNQ